MRNNNYEYKSDTTIKKNSFLRLRLPVYVPIINGVNDEGFMTSPAVLRAE